MMMILLSVATMPLIKKIKNECIKKKNAKKPSNNKEFDYYFIDNKIYHHIAVTKPNDGLSGLFLKPCQG